MKLSLSMIAVFISVFFLFSCTKSSPQTITNYDTTYIITHDTIVVVNPTNPIVGLWIGTLTAVNEPSAGELYYSYDLRSDSSILAYSLGADGKTYYSEGTWSLSATTFTATITSATASNKGTVQNITATYNKINGTLTGTWQNAPGYGSASGTIALNRIN